MRRATKLTMVAVLLGMALAVGCTDEETVFTDRPVFDEPADVAGFLGYYMVDGSFEAKQTACGNCHATYQASWHTTGHADAWAGLQSSDHAAAYCENCHTVSQLGNLEVEDVGWPATGDERYHDVQCESCHGSGLEHASGPTAANAPLCSVEAGTTATVGCGECHNGAHHPFVEQWEESNHGSTPAWEESGSTTSRASCRICHEGRQALVDVFGETSNYLEKDGTDPLPIHCVVCHDPHGTDFEGNLRADPHSSGLTNLCIRCHARSGTPPSSHGPHAAQGLLILGENVGWIPPDFLSPTFGGFLPEPHAHGETDEMCATCHVTTFEVTEPETFNSVGHTFEAISCLDAVTGVPVPGPCENTDRDFRVCDTCHGGEGQIMLEDLVAEINLLLDQLWDDEDADCVLDQGDGGLLPLVVFPDTLTLYPDDDLITVAEGAWWNAQLAYTHDRPCFGDATLYFGLAGDDEEPADGTKDGIHVSAHKASGEGIHNPDLLRALLEASIEAVIEFYGLGL
ncbi:MAG: hypothetical protein JSV86_12280 [Gemmatimonadota bacterium]|nr:MAG: hypothetical protein JSV86_12280 [Gemmatimonadota bacterium]